MRGVLEAVGVRAHGRMRDQAQREPALDAAGRGSAVAGPRPRRQGARRSGLCHQPARAGHAGASAQRYGDPSDRAPRSGVRGHGGRRPELSRHDRAGAGGLTARTPAAHLSSQLRGGRGHGCLRRAAPVPRTARGRLRQRAGAGGAGGPARAGQPRRVLAPRPQRVVPERPARTRAGLHDRARSRRHPGRTADARAEPLEPARPRRSRPATRASRSAAPGPGSIALHRPQRRGRASDACFPAACRSAAASC